MLSTPTKSNPHFKPIFFDLKIEKEQMELSILIKSNPSIEILDEIDGQLKELIKLKNPKKKLTDDETAKEIESHLNNTPIEKYGVWVYYPWLNKVIHLLDREEFIEVRTNRNQYKITPDEEEILATKKIGVIGLSVGKAIALSIALERICGELVLADFDVIELSNLNRIQTGVQNFGVKKTIVVAREIAEIDPFLKVTCLHDGLTEENITDFFTKDGNLDICIEVCDGLSIKIVARQKAKELGIPVVMDTSDRGMIDVERFDLEPNRPIFHGYIEHLDISDIKKAKTNEEKIPFILPIVGINNISTRLKASMMEVEESISTWPQLASEVLMGGGITTGVCRRILLDQFHASGRYYVDIDNIISDNLKEPTDNIKDIENYYHPHQPLAKDAMRGALDLHLKENISDERIILEESQIKILVEAGNTAPSGGNCQPWKWCYKNGVLGMFYDKSLNKSFLDYNDISAHLALGSALQNIVLKSHEIQVRVKTEIHNQNDFGLIATFSFFDWSYSSEKLESIINPELSKRIYSRCTNRNIETRKEINPKIYQEFQNLISKNSDIKLHITDDIEKLNHLEDVIGAADRLRLIHPAGYHDLFINELRLSEEEAIKKMDGVDIRTIDLNFGEIAGINLARDPKAIECLQQWDLGTGFEKISRKAVKSSSSIGIVTIPSYSMKNCIESGRIIQNIWLKATELNIGLHPLCVPIMFFARLTEGKGDGLSDDMINEVTAIRQKFLTIFPVEEKDKEIFMFRLCVAKEPKVKSLRRPINTILNFG